jgi:hypothetical protein
MYPNQLTPPQEPTPTDYLNQIAPQAPKKSIFHLGMRQIIFIGIGLVVFVSILSIIANSIAGGQKEPLQRLGARLSTTQTVVDGAQSNLKSSKLRSLNSNLKLYMTNTSRDIAAPLLVSGVDVAQLSKSVLAAESTAALSSRLEDARLNAVFDRTYAREMTYQLGTLLTLMEKIYNSTRDAELKVFLASASENLQPTQESFANFSSAADD